MSVFLANLLKTRGCLVLLAATAALVATLTTAPSDARAQIMVQSPDAVCSKICVQLVQAVGDEIKEQIPLDCVQQTGMCTGTGYFQTGEGRVPVAIGGGLTDANTLTLHISSGQTSFAPMEADALVMTLQPDMPYQTGRFVVAQKTADTPFAQAGTALTVTVIAQRPTL